MAHGWISRRQSSTYQVSSGTRVCCTSTYADPWPNRHTLCFIRVTQSLSPRFFFLFQPDKDRLQQPARGAVHTYLLFSDRTPECVVELTFLSPDSASSTANAKPRCHISFLSVLMTSLGCLFRCRRYRSTSSETQKLNRIGGDSSLVRA